MLMFNDHDPKVVGLFHGCDSEDFSDECPTAFTVQLPTEFVVCDRCRGRGKHDHPAFSNGITSDEWNGPDWDDDDRETYMRGGYDVTCEECNGLRVQEVVDEEKVPEQYRAAWAAEAAAEESNRREIAYERRCRERGLEY